MCSDKKNHYAWYHQMPGVMLIAKEKALLNRRLSTLPGGCVVQIGGPPEYEWIKSDKVTMMHLTDEFYGKRAEDSTVVVNFQHLPIQTESVDLVLIPHALAFMDNPLPILQEACRMLKANGQLIILGLNRHSLWRLWCFFGWQKEFFKAQHFLSAYKVKTELRRLGLRIRLTESVCFRPPIQQKIVTQCLSFLDVLGRLFFPSFGAGVMIVAVKEVPGMNVLPVSKMNQILNWRANQVRQTSRSMYD